MRHALDDVQCSQAGNEARTRMMKANERLVFHVARKYVGRGLDIEVRCCIFACTQMHLCPGSVEPRQPCCVHGLDWLWCCLLQLAWVSTGMVTLLALLDLRVMLSWLHIAGPAGGGHGRAAEGRGEI